METTREAALPDHLKYIINYNPISKHIKASIQCL